MAAESNPDATKSFVPSVLPWLIGAGGLLVYLITLNPWISLHSLDAMDQVTGPVWQPAVTQPLTWLLLWFFRWVPAAAAPLVLNLFAAVCAAATLTLLARTVALLPDSRGDERRHGKSSPAESGVAGWLPAVLAAIACGLQLTFWENATAASGEMIDLLLFAAIVRCLFEFRADGNPRWFWTGALLYGMGITNNWGMIGFLPVFLVAVIWLKRMDFFNLRFMLRIGLWGAAGLSFYLLLPAVQGFSRPAAVGFWTALKVNLLYQTEILSDFPQWTTTLLALTVLLPPLVIAFCHRPGKKSESGDNAVAIFLGRISLRVAHGLFLLMALWLALDLTFSPRKIGFGQPLLSYYYINALVLAYCARYFLVTGLGRFHGDSPLTILVKLSAKIGAYCSVLLLVALPVEMVWRNFGEIRLTNGPAVRRFAEQLYAGLPSGKSVALSDSPKQLILLQGALAAHNRDKDALLVDLAALPLGQYQKFMEKKFGARWPVPPGNAVDVLNRATLLAQVSQFAQQERLVCLNPGFGYYQEPFTDQTIGLVHYLMPRAPHDLSSQHMGGYAVNTNEQFWQAQWTRGLAALTEQGRPAPPPESILTDTMIGRAFLAREQNQTIASLRNGYARAFDDWGVQLQRLGRWHEAGVWFQRALLMKPDNLAAHINQLYNEQHEHGNSQRLDLTEVEKLFRDQFGKYTTWGRVIMESGPVDEPTFLNETARLLLFDNSGHQAAADYARCLELAPGWTEPQLWLAQSLDSIRDFDGALKLTDAILPSAGSLDGMQLGQLMFCRVFALEGLGRTNDASQYLAQFTREHADQDAVLATAVDLCIRSRQFDHALAYTGQLLERHPGDPELLSNRAFVQMKLAQNTEALATLNTAVSLAPTNQVFRLNRALALMETGQLDAARGDYQEVLKLSPNSRQVLFGLEEIAWRKNDTAAAIRYCEQYLASGNRDTLEYNLISNRLQKLKVEKK